MDKIGHYAQPVLDYIISFAPWAFLGTMLLWLGYKWMKKLDALLAKRLARHHIWFTVRYFTNARATAVRQIVLLPVAGSILGANVNGPVALVTVMGLAVGLLLQVSLRNNAYVVLNFCIQPYNVHDWIQEAGNYAEEEIGICNSSLIRPKNKILIVRSAKITDGEVSNFSIKGLLPPEQNVPNPYMEDFQKIKPGITKVLANMLLVLQHLPVQMGMANFDSPTGNTAILKV